MWFRFNSSGIWRHVDLSIIADVSKKPAAYLFTVQEEFVSASYPEESQHSWKNLESREYDSALSYETLDLIYDT